MNQENQNIEIHYSEDVKIIKRAILESQSRAVRMINGEQLSLYFGKGTSSARHRRTEKIIVKHKIHIKLLNHETKILENE